MPSTIIIIRSLNAGVREHELAEQLSTLNPDFKVILVVDCTSNEPETSPLFENSDFEILKITNDFLTNSGLLYAGPKTGWLCGDYVFLHALELDWDFAWVVEPDVYFINGSEKHLTSLSNRNEDLLATSISPAPKGWVWSDRLRKVGFEDTIYSMKFPLTRISRRLAQEVFSVRKEISFILGDSASPYEVPNDESVVASLAHLSQFTALDILQGNESMFQYWSTDVKYLIDELASYEDSPQFVHSGQNAEDYFSFIDWNIRKASTGDEVYRRKLISHAAHASQGTAVEILRRTLLHAFG